MRSRLPMYARLVWGLPRFLRASLSLDEARAKVAQALADREKNFLRLVRTIYGYPDSPYLFLLKSAGCEYGDIATLVRTEGLEGALRALYDQGVYVSFDEFKGRTPLVRSGRTQETSAESFDNPHLRRHFEVESGGSTGASISVGVQLDNIRENAHSYMIGLAGHGLLKAPTVLWTSVFPSGVGVNSLLRGAIVGNIPRRWFTPVTSGDLRQPLRFRFATAYIYAAARVAGFQMPRPEPLRFDEAVRIARVSADFVRDEGCCLVRGSVSTLLRVALAATEEGIDLGGVTFMGGGEPPSPAKVAGITGGGGRYVPTYVFTEGGRVGMGCVNPAIATDIHFFEHRLAVIQRPQPVPGSDTPVNVFCYTSLLPTAPKLMLNMESDDFGILEKRSCGCALESAGFPWHMSEIRSARKLTGEGITLVGSDFVRILEEVLPARFGGSALDFQLVEEEDGQGFTRLILLISPELSVPDEEEPVRVLLEAMGRGELRADGARAILSGARSVQVRREKPKSNSRGKLPPFKTVAHR